MPTNWVLKTFYKSSRACPELALDLSLALTPPLLPSLTCICFLLFPSDCCSHINLSLWYVRDECHGMTSRYGFNCSTCLLIVTRLPLLIIRISTRSSIIYPMTAKVSSLPPLLLLLVSSYVHQQSDSSHVRVNTLRCSNYHISTTHLYYNVVVGRLTAGVEFVVPG